MCGRITCQFPNFNIATIEALEWVHIIPAVYCLWILKDGMMMTSSNGNGFLWLGICEGNPPVTVEFPLQRASNVGFDIFFDVNQNKHLNGAIMLIMTSL